MPDATQRASVGLSGTPPAGLASSSRVRPSTLGSAEGTAKGEVVVVVGGVVVVGAVLDGVGLELPGQGQ